MIQLLHSLADQRIRVQVRLVLNFGSSSYWITAMVDFLIVIKWPGDVNTFAAVARKLNLYATEGECVERPKP